MTLDKTRHYPREWLDHWHVNPSSNREYDFIDGLRGIAILMVLIGHHLYINPNSGGGEHILGALVGQGGSGVKIFFALSGFLISGPFWRQKVTHSGKVIPRGYIKRRIWKIYPALALSVIIYTPFYIIINHDSTYLQVALQWLTGVAFVIPVNGKLNPVMWTLVIEVQFYMLLPLVFIFMKRLSWKACLWVITLVFLVIPSAFQLVTGLSATFHPEINSHFPSALNVFYLGIMIAALDSQRVLKKGWEKVGLLGVFLWIFILLILAYLNLHPSPSNSILQSVGGWVEIIASGFLLCFVANPEHYVARILCVPWLRWCGIISYEWYLLHQPIILWARTFLGPAGGNHARYALIVGGSFLFSTLFAALVYRYFSLPILKYGRAPKNSIFPR